MNKRWCILLLTLGLILALTGGTALAEGVQLAAPSVEAPENVISGEDFTIMITEPVAGAEHYQLIIYENDDPDDWTTAVVGEPTNGYPTDGIMTVSTADVLPGVHKWTCGDWNSDGVEYGGQTYGTVTVRLAKPNVEAPETVIRGEDFTITVTEPVVNATNYQLIIFEDDDPDNWEVAATELYDEYPAGGVMTVSTADVLPGDHKWSCGAWNGDVMYGDQIIGTVKVLFPAPTLTSPASVVRGEFLTVNVGEVEGDVLRYRAQVLDGNGEPISGGYSLLPGSMQVGTASLEPGSYTVRACAVDKNGNNGAFSDEIPFTVTENQSSEGIIVHLNKDTALCREYVLLSVYAPGAESIKICCQEEPDLGWGSESDSWAYNIYMSGPGEYHFYAEAYYADGHVETSDTVTLTFEELLGTLGEPQLELSDGPVPAGQDLTVNYSFSNPDVQDGVQVTYGFELYDLETEQDSFIDEKLAQSGTVTIPGSALEAGHRYEVYLYTGTAEPGYRTSYVQRLIFASDADDRISLTVDGQSEITVGTQENVKLNIHAPGATAIHLFKGRNDDWDYWGDHNGFNEDIEYDWSHWADETVALYINVCFDPDYDNENAEWFTSDPLIVHVTADNGRLATPQFTMPAQVNVGDVLDIEVTYDENASWCFADLYTRNEDGEIDWNSLAHADADGQGHIYLPTAMLQPGQAYLVHVSCGGFNWLDSIAAQGWFTATGEATDQPQFSVSKTDVLTNESFTALGYVPNARFLRVYSDGNKDDEWGFWGGDHFNANWFSVGRIGDTNLTLAACFQDSWDNWDEWQDVATITIHGTANEYYDSEYMRSLVPATLNSGEDLVINLPEGITGNWANVWDDTAGGPHIYWMNWDEGRESNYNYFDLDNPDAWAAGGEGPDEPCFHGEGGNILIPAQYLKPNHTYRLDMDMWGGIGVAYEGVNGVKFSVVEPSQNEIALTINGSQDDQTLQVNEEWTVRVSAPGATAIRFFDGWGWHPRWVDENGVWEDGWSDGADGTKPRYAQACYDPIDQDTFDDNWDSLNWQGVSNVIRLTFTANGQIEAATFTLDNAVVSRGDFAVLRLNGMVEGAQYHANAYWRDEDDNENWMGDRWYEHENSVIMLPTIDMGPGEWIIRLDSYGLVGLFGNSWESTVTITESSSASLNFSKYDVQTNERFWNAIQVPGAVEITTTVNEPDDWQIGDWDNVWQFGPWDGEATQGDALWFDHSGTYTVKLYARMSENGGWEYTGASKTITATATHYYSSEYLRSLVPATLNSGEDLVINLPEGVTGDWANVWDDTAGGPWIYMMNWDEGRQSDYNYWDVDGENGCWEAGGEDPFDPCFHGEGGNIYIPAQYLKPNHTYRLNMDMWGGVGTAHDDGVYDVKFIVVPGTDNRVKLRVNGMSGNVNVDVNAWYTVKATASGADEIRVFDGYNWHYAGGDTFEENWRNGGNETRTLYAQARYNGGDWEGISNIITVTSYSEQQVPVDFFIVNDNATVAKGDELVLRVAAVDLEAEYNAHVKWMDENNNEQWIDGNYGLDGDTIRVSTNNLWEGEFYVRLDVFGKEGYCDNCLDLPFTVTRGNAFFLVDKTEVEVMEQIHVSVYDPDAEKIRFSSGYGWWDENGWDGDSWIGDIGWDHSPDDVTIAAEGWHGNEWVEIGHADIRITAPNGQLDEPAIDGSACQMIEDGLNFGIEMPEGASYYYVEVWEATDNYDNRVWKFNSENMEWNEWFHIDGSELQAGTAYTVYVNACGYGYECHATQRDITMVAERQPAPEFTVSSNTVTHGEFIHMYISNFDPGTNYHAYFRGGYIDDLLDVWTVYNGSEIIISSADLLEPGEYRLCLDVFDKPGFGDNGTEMNITVNNNGGRVFFLTDDHATVGNPLPVYAFVQGAEQIHVVLEKDGEITNEWYEDGEKYLQTVDSWNPGTYTAKAYARYGNDWTLIDSHTLEITSRGQSLAPELTVASQILQPGEMPTITFGEGDNVDWYKLIIWTDDGWVLNHDIEEGPGTHTVDPSWFEEGKTLEAGKSYTMNISVWNGGYEPGWSNDVPIAVIDSSCSELTLNVPAALTEIEEEAFAGTPAKIVRINANPGLHISSRAFADSSIIVAVIPDGVNVDPNAFEGCGPVVIVPSLD